MKKYDAIIIGGGYAAAGWMSAAGGENLVICDSIYPDEFSSCLRQATDGFETEIGKQLHNEFDSLGLIRKGIADTVRGAKIICRMYESLGADILYNTFVKNISETSVTVANDDGTTVFEGKRVVDLRPCGDKYFWNIIVEGKVPGSIDHFYDDLSIIRLEFSGDFKDARKKFEEFKKNQPGLKIVIAAAEAEKGGVSSPFTAFEQGYKSAKGL